MFLQRFIRNHFRAVLQLVYPEECAICGKALLYRENHVCSGCILAIRPLQEPLCKKCSLELPRFADDTRTCSSCRQNQFHFCRAFSCIRYDEQTKKIFHEVKFHNRRSLLRVYDALLEQKITHIVASLKDHIVIPVPLDRARRRIRDFNQSALLGKRIARLASLQYSEGLLRRVKKSAPQSLLGKKERLHNLDGAFRVPRGQSVLNRNIALVDDVFTTGSTVNECAKTLRAAGAAKVTVITLARAQ